MYVEGLQETSEAAADLAGTQRGKEDPDVTTGVADVLEEDTSVGVRPGVTVAPVGAEVARCHTSTFGCSEQPARVLATELQIHTGLLGARLLVVVAGAEGRRLVGETEREVLGEAAVGDHWASGWTGQSSVVSQTALVGEVGLEVVPELEAVAEPVLEPRQEALLRTRPGAR